LAEHADALALVALDARGRCDPGEDAAYLTARHATLSRLSARLRAAL
jgi:hypothetical protein